MTLLIVEPFYGGSHKQLVDLLHRHYSGDSSSRSLTCAVFTLPAKKWHWRARTSALFFAQVIPRDVSYKVIFTSSVLNLAELVALRPDLQALKKTIYFHENQLVYPVRKQQLRDFQFGYNQILSCLVADVALFNSQFNRDSFLDNLESFLHTMPDCRPTGVRDQLLPKCRVLYYPVKFVTATRQSCQHWTCIAAESNQQQLDASTCIAARSVNIVCDTDSCADIADSCADTGDGVSLPVSTVCDTDSCADIADSCADTGDGVTLPVSTVCDTDSCANSGDGVSLPASIRAHCEALHIVWPHRWEHDKNPEAFFTILYQLDDDGLDFKLSVLGQTFTDVPAVFAEAQERLSDHIVNYGYIESPDDYHRTLSTADVAVSTALHEFFGVAMLEAVYAGCYPLCPRRLVYPEIFPDECLYNTDRQLLKRLRTFCRNPAALRTRNFTMDLTKFSWEKLSAEYEHYIETQEQT